MTAGLKPFLVKGDAAKEAAWERLTAGRAAASADFLRRERVFSVVWGAVLLGECVLRVVGAYTVPVETMVWLGSVVMVVAMGAGFVVGGALGAGPMQAMVAEEAARERSVERGDVAVGETAEMPVVALAR